MVVEMLRSSLEVSEIHWGTEEPGTSTGRGTPERTVGKGDQRANYSGFTDPDNIFSMPVARILSGGVHFWESWTF